MISFKIRWSVNCAALAAILLSGNSASAQALAKPGPEHKILQSMAGYFKADIKLWAEPGKSPESSQGTMKRSMILGGLFLQEDFAGKMMGMDFAGAGFTGYDVQKKKYVAVWLDNMSGSIMSMDVTYDDKSKTISGAFDDVDPATGKKVRMRDVIRVVSPDHQIQEMFTIPEGGAEIKTMEIHYHRVK